MTEAIFTKGEFDEVYTTVKGLPLKARQVFISIAFGISRPTTDELRSMYIDLVLSECRTIEEASEVLKIDVSTIYRHNVKQEKKTLGLRLFEGP